MYLNNFWNAINYVNVWKNISVIAHLSQLLFFHYLVWNCMPPLTSLA